MKAETIRSGRGDLTLSGFIAAACVALVLVFAAYWLSIQQSRAAAWVSHTHEVLTTIARTRAALVDIQNGHRGFTVSGAEEELEPYRKGRAAIHVEMPKLRRLLADSPAQQPILDELEKWLVARLASAEQLVAARREGGFPAAKAIVDTGAPGEEMIRLRGVLQRLEAGEENLLRQRLADHAQRLRWFWAGMTALVALLLGALAVLYAQVRRRRAAQQALLESEQRFQEQLLAEIQERKRIDEELQELNRSLEAVVRERTAELRDANSGLLDAKQRLHDLSSQLISAHEQERRRIAHELHGDTAQALTVIRMHLTDAMRGVEGAAERVPESIRVVDSAIAHIRRMALSLRPTMLDDLGLVDALQWLVEQHAKPAGWKCSLDMKDLDRELPADVQTACFRIAQESLGNAAEHAGATEMKLILKIVGDQLELTVADNGAGFDLAHYQQPEERKKHFGLFSMTERANLVGGRLDIETAPGQGTRVRAIFPLPAQSGSSREHGGADLPVTG